MSPWNLFRRNGNLLVVNSPSYRRKVFPARLRGSSLTVWSFSLPSHDLVRSGFLVVAVNYELLQNRASALANLVWLHPVAEGDCCSSLSFPPITPGTPRCVFLGCWSFSCDAPCWFEYSAPRYRPFASRSLWCCTFPARPCQPCPRHGTSFEFIRVCTCALGPRSLGWLTCSRWWPTLERGGRLLRSDCPVSPHCG